MPEMGKCKDCEYYNPRESLKIPMRVYTEGCEQPKVEILVDRETGSCRKLNYLALCVQKHNAIYPQNSIEEMFVGNEFGCIHFERRAK